MPKCKAQIDTCSNCHCEALTVRVELVWLMSVTFFHIQGSTVNMLVCRQCARVMYSTSQKRALLWGWSRPLGVLATPYIIFYNFWHYQAALRAFSRVSSPTPL